MPPPARDASDLTAVLAEALAALPEVELPYLFGSHASGRVHPESDIDLGVLVTGEAAADPRRTLALLFDRLGRVVRSDRLDLVLLNAAPSLLRHRVVSTGKLLFERDPRTRVRFVFRTIQDCQDMQVRREFFYRKRVEHIREGRADGGSGDLLAQARRAARLLGEAGRVQADD